MDAEARFEALYRARAGFSDVRPRMPFELGASGRIGAIVWGQLDSPPSEQHRNKILWVARSPDQSGSPLRISAQRMDGTRPTGSTCPTRDLVSGSATLTGG